jgi:hypothetical protein
MVFNNVGAMEIGPPRFEFDNVLENVIPVSESSPLVVTDASLSPILEKVGMRFRSSFEPPVGFKYDEEPAHSPFCRLSFYDFCTAVFGVDFDGFHPCSTHPKSPQPLHALNQAMAHLSVSPPSGGRQMSRQEKAEELIRDRARSKYKKIIKDVRRRTSRKQTDCEPMADVPIKWETVMSGLDAVMATDVLLFISALGTATKFSHVVIAFAHMYRALSANLETDLQGMIAMVTQAFSTMMTTSDDDDSDCGLDAQPRADFSLGWEKFLEVLQGAKDSVNSLKASKFATSVAQVFESMSLTFILKYLGLEKSSGMDFIMPALPKFSLDPVSFGSALICVLGEIIAMVGRFISGETVLVKGEIPSLLDRIDFLERTPVTCVFAEADSKHIFILDAIDESRSIKESAEVLCAQVNRNNSLALGSLMSRANRMYDTLLSQSHHATTRTPPIWIHLDSRFGGEGKSFLMTMIERTICAALNMDVDPMGRGSLTESKHHDNLFNHTRIILADDIGTVKPEVAPPLVLQTLMHIVNAQPYMYEKAVAQDKGKHFCNAVMVISSANNLFDPRGYVACTMMNPTPLLRRMMMSITVVLSEKARAPGLKTMDAKRFGELYLKDPLAFDDWWSFVVEKHTGQEWVTLFKTNSLVRLLQEVAIMSKLQVSISDVLAHFFRDVHCRGCCLPLLMCICPREGPSPEVGPQCYHCGGTHDLRQSCCKCSSLGRPSCLCFKEEIFRMRNPKLTILETNSLTVKYQSVFKKDAKPCADFGWMLRIFRPSGALAALCPLEMEAVREAARDIPPLVLWQFFTRVVPHIGCIGLMLFTLLLYALGLVDMLFVCTMQIAVPVLTNLSGIHNFGLEVRALCSTYMSEKVEGVTRQKLKIRFNLLNYTHPRFIRLAAFGAVCTTMGAFGLLYRSVKPDAYSRSEVIPKQSSRNYSYPPATEVNNISRLYLPCTLTNHDATADLLSKCLVSVQLQGARSTGIVIGSYLLLCAHAVVEEGVGTMILDFPGKSNTYPVTAYKLDNMNSVVVDKYDLLVVAIKGPPRKDILKYFPSTDLPPTQWCEGVTVMWIDSDLSLKRFDDVPLLPCPRVLTYRKSSENQVKWMINLTVPPGSSGGLVIGRIGPNFGVIGRIVASNSMVSLVMPISVSQISDATSSLSAIPTSTFDHQINFPVKADFGKNSYLAWTKQKGISVGELVPFVNFTTKFTCTPMPTHERFISRLLLSSDGVDYSNGKCESKWENDEFVSPWLAKGRKTLSLPESLGFRRETYKLACSQAVAALLSSLAPGLTVAPLSIDTVVNGDISRDIRPMDLTKSAGPGFGGIKSSHFDCSEVNGRKVYHPKEELVARLVKFRKVVYGLDSGCIVAQDCLKNEVLKQTKYARVFYAGALDSYIEMKRLLEPLFAICRVNRRVTGNMIGVNATSFKEWGSVYSQLTRFPNRNDGDFEGYDVHHDFWSIVHLFGDFFAPLAFSLGYPEKDVQAIVNLGYMLSSAVHLCCGCVYIAIGEILSGIFGTSDTNTTLGWIYFRYCFLVLCPEYTFEDHVSLILYGDDVAFSVSDTVFHLFNMVTIIPIMKELNQVITNAKKDGQVYRSTPVEQITFLKRFFRVTPEGVCAPLQKASIFRMLCYYIPTTAGLKVQASGIFSSANDESFQWGELFYNELHCELVEEANKVCAGYGDTLASYSELLLRAQSPGGIPSLMV